MLTSRELFSRSTKYTQTLGSTDIGGKHTTYEYKDISLTFYGNNQVIVALIYIILQTNWRGKTTS